MAQDPWAVVSTTPAPPPAPVPKQPKDDPWAVVDTKPAEKPAQSSIHYDESHQPQTDTTVEAYKPTWTERIRKSVTNSQPFHALETYAPGVASALHLTPTDVSGTEQYYTHKGQLVGLENLAEGAFRKDPADKAGAGERIATGAAKAVSGLTSPDMLLLQAIPMGDLLGLGGGVAKMVLPRLVTAGFGASMAKGLVDQWKEREEAKAAGDDGTAHEIEGEMSVSAAMLLLMGHAATREISEAVQTHANAEALDQHAQEVYKADYKDLSDKQKATVIYNVAADADPLVKARVDQETKRLAKVAEKSGLPSIKEVGETDATRRQEYEQRAQAAKNLTQQVVARQRAAAQYRQDAQMREAETRRAQAAQQKEIDRAAAEAKSPEQQRGFPVEESRETQNLPATGLHKTTEREPGQRYDPEPAEPAIPVVDRRTLQPKIDRFQGVNQDEGTIVPMRVNLLGPEEKAKWEDSDEYITVYRAVKSGVNALDHGDMVTLTRKDAEGYADRPGVHVIEQRVRKSDVQWVDNPGVWPIRYKPTVRQSIAGLQPETLTAEFKVNELSEQRMGQSFASLPLARQRVAGRWMERFQPEAWQAFQATPAYQSFQDHVEMAGMADAALKHYLDRTGRGQEEQLAPNADIHAGVARLILDRTNIAQALQADKETHRELNEHSEQAMGKSFDTLAPEDRVPALAEFLRDKPDKLKAFLTPDVAERIRSGQHIDLANIDDELRNRQQGQVLMEFRDQIQRDMERAVAGRLVAEQREARNKELSETMYQALTGHEATLEPVHAASRDLTRDATELGLGPVSNYDDLFRIEKTIRDTRPDLRTGKMQQFLTRMQQVRAAAEDHILQTIAKNTADSFRESPEDAREKAAKQVIDFIGKANDLQDAADNLRAEGSKAANEAEREANAEKAKADAVEAGAVTAQSAAPESQVRRDIPISIGRETRVVSPRNETGAPAHYAVVDMGELQTSHLPQTFEKRPGYDQNGQPRDYSTDKDAQTAVASRANNLDLDVLLGNGVTTMEGPAIMDQRGHVISGNGRTLSLLSADSGELGRYTQELHDRAASFGIDPAEVFKYKRPVLVKVLDAPVESGAKWALMGKDMNDSSSRGISETDMGVAAANLLSPEYVDRLTKIVESLPSDVTIREAMRARSAEIAKLLTDVGAIAPNRLVEYVDKETGDLKEKAKDLFENMLSGFTVTDPAVLGRASASVKDKLTRAGLSYIRMRNAGENWNLASMNTDAVKLLTRAQDAAARLSSLLGKESGKGTGSGSLVERYLHPERYFDPTGRSVELSFDGQPLHAPVHAGVEALAMALEESPKEYAKLMAKFADRAEGMQQTMWGAEHPADAFTNEIADQYDLKVVPEEWGAVVGLSDQVKAEIEEARGPLPVEAAAHAETAVADVLPNSSMVLDVIPEGPRTVRDLQRAMESHPNLSPEEIEAANQILTEIMPRAIGESLENLLGNRRLIATFGGAAEGNRGYHQMISDASTIVNVSNTGDISTWLHEVTHFIRQFLNPADQEVANRFVGAKPGEEWTPAQEEMFTKAHERYIYDGGIRRGKLEKVFGVISRAMQRIYTEAQARGLIKGTPELNAMFDRWYDWSRAERKPITARVDVDQLVENANGKVEIPANAKVVQSSGPSRKLAEGHSYVFMDEDSARQFVEERKKDLIEWQILRTGHGDEPVYVQAVARKGKKLFQPSLNEMLELAKKAKSLEEQLKRTTDPREQARLRGALNGIEDKMKGATGIIGAKSEPRDASVIQLVNGMGDMPGREPTTPVQAATAHQVFGDPTSVELGGERGVKRAVSDATAGEGSRATEGVDGGRGKDDGEHAPIAKPKSDPLAKVKAAKLAAPKIERGTPVVDPGKWREHVEALGLPDGTPPPTVRLAPDIRNLMIYPGQSEAVEGVLSALQQYDGTILASGAGTGKTHMLSAIAENLLGTGGDKVGLLVTRSQNLIHEADGFVETARKYGVDVQAMPSKIKDMTTGMYAATYSGIRGNRDMLSIPWDFVLFDESGEAANWTESEQGKAVVLLGHAAKKAVYSSATPYSTVMELGYMHKLDLWPKGGFFEWAQQFGLHEVGPNTYAGGAAAKKLEKLRQQLIERGQWQQLYKDMSGTEAHVALVPQTPEVREGVRSIRAAFAMAKNAFIRAGMSKYITPTAGHESIYLKRFISGARLKDAIELGKKAVAAGWTPVFFTEYRSPAEEGMEFFHNLPGDLGKTINKMLPPLPDVVGEMRKAFGNKVGIFAGEANEARATELEEFHTGQKDALYMTYAAGGVGANGQDKVGDKPRFGVFIDMPWGGKMLEQGTNRTWRYGSKSGVVNVFLTSDALPEMKLLATKVLPRMRALKAAVFGEKMESSLSRKLRDAAGIPEELLQYEHGEEVAPQAAEFEQDGEGAKYTPLSDYEVPSVKKFQNKPMEYKGRGRKLYQPGDRRQNSALRKRIAEMSPEELRKTLLTSDVVDLPNGRAFDEAEREQPAAAVAMSDADGLKAFNDKFGYEAGNALLQAKAAALKAAGLEAYHEKGDEFLFRGQSPDELRTKLEQARDVLRNVQFDVEADGKKMTLKGVDFSYGTGTDLHEAEDGLHEHKDEREAAGERQRGELGGIIEVQRGDNSRAERGVRLYQGPKDEDPWQRAANDAWDELLGRTAKLPAREERVIAANEGAIKAEAAAAGRRAMRTGEPAEAAVKRTTRDMENEALIWMDDMKDQGGAAAHFVKSTIWMFGTSGDRAVEKIAADAGYAKEGAELKRRMIDYDIRSGNYRGELGGMVEKIIFDHNLKPRDLETVSKVVEGKATSNDPRINQAVADFRKFTATVRKKLANAGMAVVFYNEKGQRSEFPYSKIEDDPNYWPRIYDWGKKFVIDDGKGGKTITSLGDIMRMPSGSERREALIEQFAKQRGISKVQAQLFFDRNARGIRLAGNVERAREYELPLYGRDRKALDRYVNEVAEKLASAEVHGQFREKTDPLIDKLPDEKTRKLVNHIITADLDPARLHDADRVALRWANRWLVLSKMSLSALKLPFHLAKTSLATNTRSVIHAMLKGAISPREVRQNAVDSGAMTNYIKQAWLREYGMKSGGLDQKMLDFNGFTAVLNFSRVISAGAGRLWFEKYAYPALVKDPKNPILRRKLVDLYGFNEGQLDDIAKSGYGPKDVRRMELGAANWTTGSGRPSELPPALRGTTGDPLYDRLTTLLRISQSLHGFMFKTANLVNRTVWQELLKSDWKSPAPYQLVARFAANFGLAGWALHEILHLRHQMSGSPEAEMEKRRKEWLDAHPVSKEALFTAMSDITMGMGIDVLTQFFDELATHDPKDKEKLVQQERTLNAARDLVVGVFPNDVYTAVKATKDYQATFEDTGKHQLSPGDRRSQILERLANEEVPLSRYVVKPLKVKPRPFPRRSRHASSVLQ